MTKASQPKGERRSFSLRLQPYDGSLLAEVVDYLNSGDRSDAQRQVEDVLVMCFLSKARLYNECCSGEERRRACIESCDALEKHASNLRQLVGVEMPWQLNAQALSSDARMTAARSSDPPAAVEMPRVEDDGNDDDDDFSVPEATLAGEASAAQMDAMFDEAL